MSAPPPQLRAGARGAGGLIPPGGMARITAITAPANPLLVRLRRLAAQPDAYRKQGRVLLQGEHLCEAFLAHRPAGAVQAVVGEGAWAVPRLRALASRAEAVALVPDPLMA